MAVSAAFLQFLTLLNKGSSYLGLPTGCELGCEWLLEWVFFCLLGLFSTLDVSLKFISLPSSVPALDGGCVTVLLCAFKTRLALFKYRFSTDWLYGLVSCIFWYAALALFIAFSEILKLDLFFLISSLDDDDFKLFFSVNWSCKGVFKSQDDEEFFKMLLGLLDADVVKSGAEVDSSTSGEVTLSALCN